MALGHDDAGSSKNCARTKHGADVMRVGYLIHQNNRPVGRDRCFCNIGQFDRQERCGFDNNALMHGVHANQPVKIAWRCAIDRVGSNGNGLSKLALGVFCRPDGLNAASRMPESKLDCVQAVYILIGGLLASARRGGSIAPVFMLVSRTPVFWASFPRVLGIAR